MVTPKNVSCLTDIAVKAARMEALSFIPDDATRYGRVMPDTASPQLNGKVERSHRTDKQESHQLLTHTDDVDLRARLSEWEQFYNFSPDLTVHSTERHLTRCFVTGYN